MRKTFLVLALLPIAACGDDGSVPASVATDPPTEAASTTTRAAEAAPGTTAAPGSTTPAGSASTTTVASTTTTMRPRPEGPDAPDFTLALGEGGIFTLSEEQNPVYMVFWAEW